MREFVIGIDPGLHGGWAVLEGTGGLVACGPTPIKIAGKKTIVDGPVYAARLRPFIIPPGNRVTAYIEQVSSRPGQAKQFQFGMNCGIAHGIMHALGTPITLVTPQAWKSTYNIKRTEDGSRKETKNEARAVAAKLYSAHAFRFARVKDDGVAEAVLIALHGIYSKAKE